MTYPKPTLWGKMPKKLWFLKMEKIAKFNDYNIYSNKSNTFFWFKSSDRSFVSVTYSANFTKSCLMRGD